MAVPLLALYLPLTVAAPLAVLISITIAAVVVVQDWRKIHLRSTGWLFGSTLAGIPFGLWLLTSTHQRAVKIVLAIVILAFSLYSLLGRKPPELKHESHVWMLGCGFCAGVLGGAYGMNGPPLVIYGAMRRWSAQHFRATLQGYFLPASIVGMAGYEDALARQLSAGQKKRLSLARLWLSPSPLWLLDEPYANLDLDGITLVNRMISAHLRDGGAALVTTHGAYAAPPVQTRMLVLERGGAA